MQVSIEQQRINQRLAELSLRDKVEDRLKLLQIIAKFPTPDLLDKLDRLLFPPDGPAQMPRH